MQTSDAAVAASAGVVAIEGALASAVMQPVLQGWSTLRLLAPPGAVERLQEAPVIAQHARNRGVVRRVDTIFYDTSDCALFGSGLSLRVQRQGRRFTQTLKQHRRPQQIPCNCWTGLVWGAPVETALPDLSLLAGAEIESLTPPLVERLSAAPLVAMFETRLRRQVRRLELSGALVDIAFDEGTIGTESRQEALTEVRLALRGGEVGVLYDIGLRLMELASLRVSTSGTARRGYALASGAPPRAEKAAPSALSPHFAVDDMVAAVIAGCQEHLQANQPVAEDGRSPEGVHQVRVALRRMRTALSLLRREIPSATMRSLSADAKWVADEFGAARNWDVFLATTLAQPARLRTAGADFDGLRRAAEAPRAAGYAAVRAVLEAPRYGRLQLSLGQWIARRGWRNEVDREGLAVLAEPAPAMAARVLNRLHRKALKQGRHFKRLSAVERHELRITLKKLRYAMEFFLPLCAEAAQAQRYLGRLAGLQEALGFDHDAATTQPLLEEIGRASRSCGVHQAIGMVAGWQARDGLAAGETLARRWKRFKTLAPFWTRPAAAGNGEKTSPDAAEHHSRGRVTRSVQPG